MTCKRFSTALLIAAAIWSFVSRPALAAPAAYFTVNLVSGASAADARSVADYFRDFGLSVDVRGGILFVAGNSSGVAAAGNTSFASYEVGGIPFERAVQPPTFPRAIASKILATTLAGGPPSEHATAVVQPDLDVLPAGGFTPAGLATFYDASSLYAGGTNGAGFNIAVVACDGFKQTDISAFEAMMGLPANSPTVVAVDGGSTAVSVVTALDAENLIGAAPGAGIYVYEAPSSKGVNLTCSLSEIADAMAAIAADMPTHHFVSVSVEYGGTEDYYVHTSSQSIMTATGADIATIVNDGGTVFVASGTNGAGPPNIQRLSGGEFTVFYPASDPKAVAVGGTAAIPVSPTNLTRASELGWGFSGGGVSGVFAIPGFQKGLSGLGSTTMRDVPDVALDASANTQVAIYVGGMAGLESGTNIGADYWSGWLALADQARGAASKAPLTNVAAKIYAARKVAGALIPITKGCNSYYCAGTKAYNNVTGIGVPDVKNLVNYLVGLP